MQRDASAFLWDVRDAAQLIESFVGGSSFEKFAGNVLVRSAVERQFEIIGEALSQLARISPELARQIPDISRIVAFRNILIHGYAALDHSIVWKVIHENLPELRSAVDRLLAANVPGQQ
jgi:uncharacterized protein with HEPN domain